MIKIKRDTTRDLFNAVLQLVKDKGCYDKAAAIMDYVLPNISEYNSREDIELSNYGFDFHAAPQFGGSEGIYISCWISGEYSEKELKYYDANKGTAEKETRRSVGTFKTLRTDLEAMQIMGELCGYLVFYASQYVNEQIDRYSPMKELEWQERHKKCNSARNHYISTIAKGMVSAGECEPCADKACKGKQNGCEKGIARFISREVGKHSTLNRYSGDERNVYFDFLEGKQNFINDFFDAFVTILANAFPDLSQYQAIGYVFVWLCTRKKDFNFTQEQEE